MENVWNIPLKCVICHCDWANKNLIGLWLGKILGAKRMLGGKGQSRGDTMGHRASKMGGMYTRQMSHRATYRLVEMGQFKL